VTGHEPHPQRHLGDRQGGVPAEQTLRLELAEKLGALCGQPTQKGRDVELGEDEADFALRTVKVDRAPQHDHHAFGEGNPVLGQGALHRQPRALPTLDLEGRRPTAPGERTSATFVRVHEIEVAVAGATGLVRETVDLAPHPERALSRKSRGQRRLHLVVEGADGKHPSAVAFLHPVVVLRARRSLGVEELMGVARHPRHPTEAVYVPNASRLMADWRRR
jgi:hypothetical protein